MLSQFQYCHFQPNRSCPLFGEFEEYSVTRNKWTVTGVSGSQVALALSVSYGFEVVSRV